MDAKAATPVKARRPQLPVVTPQPEARPLKRRPSLGRLSFTLLSHAASPRPELPGDPPKDEMEKLLLKYEQAKEKLQALELMYPN